MRNEIFARHGYIFKSEDLREYFGQQSWYNPRYDNVENYLSDIERYNIELIKNGEFEGSLAVIDDPDGYTNIRSGPGVNFNIIGIIREGEEFYARASSSNWWEIKTKTGVVGYMHKSRIHIIR